MSKMKQIEENLIEYIEDQHETDDNYLYDFVIENKVKSNKYDLNSFLHLLSYISNHHQRSHYLIKKIETMILNLQSEIANFFTNVEIFHIFEDNKRILHFLFEQGIIKQDKNVLAIIQNRHQNYIQYLFLVNFAVIYNEILKLPSKFYLVMKNRFEHLKHRCTS